MSRIDIQQRAPVSRPSASRGTWLGPVSLVVSVVARLVWTYSATNGANFVDLHVYVEGAAVLGTGARLYDFVYADQTPDFPLPFTYPPFAAIVFYPLHLLPFPVVALGWHLLTMAALYAVVRCTQRLLGGGTRGVAAAWTAVGIWIEPLRATLDYGQVNVLLVLAVLAAAASSRWWFSGALIGVAAGIKLTPAVFGLYLLGVRRVRAAAASAGVFAATVAVSLLVVGDQAAYYFTDLLGDARRVGPVGTATNQSWRGALSRIAGYDLGTSWPVLVAVAATAVLAVAAWRAVVRRSGTSDDRLAGVLIVALFGLLLSPISWSHHWVWVLPLAMWLIHGPLRAVRGAAVLGWGWLALVLVGPPWLLNLVQPSIWEISRPWYLAWAGLVYVVAALVTLGWMAAAGRRR